MQLRQTAESVSNGGPVGWHLRPSATTETQTIYNIHETSSISWLLRYCQTAVWRVISWTTTTGKNNRRKHRNTRLKLVWVKPLCWSDWYGYGSSVERYLRHNWPMMTTFEIAGFKHLQDHNSKVEDRCVWHKSAYIAISVSRLWERPPQVQSQWLCRWSLQ